MTSRTWPCLVRRFSLTTGNHIFAVWRSGSGKIGRNARGKEAVGSSNPCESVLPDDTQSLRNAAGAGYLVTYPSHTWQSRIKQEIFKHEARAGKKEFWQSDDEPKEDIAAFTGRTVVPEPEGASRFHDEKETGWTSLEVPDSMKISGPLPSVQGKIESVMPPNSFDGSTEMADVFRPNIATSSIFTENQTEQNNNKDKSRRTLKEIFARKWTEDSTAEVGIKSPTDSADSSAAKKLSGGPETSSNRFMAQRKAEPLLGDQGKFSFLSYVLACMRTVYAVTNDLTVDCVSIKV